MDISAYVKMSDFEIDKAVAEIMFPSKKVTNFAGEAVVWGSDNSTRIVRYCNSWSDAGPIIQKNEINLNKESAICCELCWESYNKDTWEASHIDYDEEPCDKNPLRAAMIMFLIIKGVK